MIFNTYAYLVSSVFFIVLFAHAVSEAYDPLDPTGNITIKWDVISWTADGYTATVTMTNYQMYRHIMSPGWTMGWTWAKKEVIWSMLGAEATEQGDCSKYKGNIPYCCEKKPTILDLLPGAPYNQQVANCCKGGVVPSWGQDPSAAISSFQLTVGSSGTSSKTVKLPKNFTLNVTWNVVCTYSQFLASPSPTCCVSMSSFYNSTIVTCPTCACGCQNRENCIT
ncbi:cobra-like protein 4 [Quercus suber]|uniref:Cobra-like protein 4 n=1 Tax=Quercus suber TaxID=58331 RepID=A0AAW0ID56_QUESU